MGAFIICVWFWAAAVILETSLFTIFPWFKPNLFFLFSCIFCLRWKGFETHILAAVFGLTADCFSAVPFGVYGFSFFIVSFFTRWYAIRIYQGSTFVSIILVAIVTLINYLLIFFLLNLFFAEGDLTFRGLVDLITYEIIPTSVLSVPGLSVLQSLEARYRVRLAKRKI